MLDPQFLRQHPELVANSCKKRGLTFDTKHYALLEQRRKNLQTEVEQLRHRRTVGAKEIAALIKNNQDAEHLKKQMQEVQQRIKPEAEKLNEVLAALLELQLQLPNLTDDSVPEGKDEASNRTELVHGDIPKFSFKPKQHYEILPNWQDMAMASRMAGSRFTLFSGELALLHRALIQMMLDIHIREHNYTEVYVPVIVNKQALVNSGQLPKFAEDLFHLQETDYCLIPTGEVPLVNVAAGRIFQPEELPLKLTAHSPCFRSEAGSYGKDVKGMLRLHQFDKVELVQITHPEKSEEALEEMCGQAQNILQKLELPYRVVTLCGGDIGHAAAKTYDLEVWLPGQNNYREISSCSNCREYQARRMLARVNINGNKVPVHTLNASGLAVGRTLIAVMENYQTADGSVRIPDALRPWTGNLTEIRSTPA